jgi:DNA-binding NarL/FixJ family response regulator
MITNFFENRFGRYWRVIRSSRSSARPRTGLKPYATPANFSRIVILDITMPVLGGIEAAVRIRGIAPRARIIFLSQYNSSSIAQTALATRALAYVVKSAVSTDLIPAVQSVVEGKTFLSKLD